MVAMPMMYVAECYYSTNVKGEVSAAIYVLKAYVYIDVHQALGRALYNLLMEIEQNLLLHCNTFFCNFTRILQPPSMHQFDLDTKELDIMVCWVYHSVIVFQSTDIMNVVTTSL